MPVWRRLDSLGDHRSACAQVGVLAHRAGPLERAAARICREAGVRVATRVALLRELNLDVPPLTAGGLRSSHGVPLWRGAQIAVDTTLVRPVQPLAPGARDPGPMRGQRWHFNKPKTRKLRTYPEPATDVVAWLSTETSVTFVTRYYNASMPHQNGSSPCREHWRPRGFVKWETTNKLKLA